MLSVLSSQHGAWIITLKNVLNHFHNATYTLSDRNYEIVAPGKIIAFELKTFYQLVMCITIRKIIYDVNY